MAPCTSTDTPRGFVSSWTTETSTSPEIGERSGDVMTILGAKSSTVVPKRLSVALVVGRKTLTGILRGVNVPNM